MRTRKNISSVRETQDHERGVLKVRERSKSENEWVITREPDSGVGKGKKYRLRVRREGIKAL